MEIDLTPVGHRRDVGMRERCGGLAVTHELIGEPGTRHQFGAYDLEGDRLVRALVERHRDDRVRAGGDQHLDAVPVDQRASDETGRAAVCVAITVAVAGRCCAVYHG